MAYITDEIQALIVYGRRLERGEFETFEELENFAGEVESVAPQAGQFIYCGVGDPEQDYGFYGQCVLGRIVETFHEEEQANVAPNTWNEPNMASELWSSAEQKANFTFADDGPGWYMCVTGWGWVRLVAIDGEDAPAINLPYADAEGGDGASRITDEMLAYLRAHPVTTTVSYC